MIEVREHDATTHLIKFAAINPISGHLFYPFAAHNRFIFWMNDRIRRHRTMEQGNVFLNCNTGDATMTIEDLKKVIANPHAFKAL